jgi:hypothetical protein
MFLGRREPAYGPLQSSLARRSNLNTCVVQPRWCTSMLNYSQNTLPRDNCARTRKRKKTKNPLSGGVYPLTTGSLIRVRLGPDILPRTGCVLPPGPPSSLADSHAHKDEH